MTFSIDDDYITRKKFSQQCVLRAVIGPRGVERLTSSNQLSPLTRDNMLLHTCVWAVITVALGIKKWIFGVYCLIFAFIVTFAMFFMLRVERSNQVLEKLNFKTFDTPGRDELHFATTNENRESESANLRCAWPN